MQALHAVKTFKADAVVVSLGLDTFEGEPISGFTLKSDDYFAVGAALASAELPTLRRVNRTGREICRPGSRPGRWRP